MNIYIPVAAHIDTIFNSTACACSVRRREEGEGEKKGSKRNREDRRKGNEGR